MGIDFSKERWQRVIENSQAWWAGELKRPLIQITIGGHDPGRPEPALPLHGYASFYDLSIPAEAIVDRWDHYLSCQRYLGGRIP